MKTQTMLCLFMLAGSAGMAVAQTPAPMPMGAQPAVTLSQLPAASAQPSATQVLTGETSYAVASDAARGFLESDHAFDNFVSPVSNPVLSKDPRNMTEARFLFINNVLPPNHALGGGGFQAYALQLRAALTDRLTLIADKDGIASISAKGIDHRTGILNMNFGLRYLFVRDVESQFLLSGGFTYEPPMGGANVFQNHGAGVMTVFSTWGKEFGGVWHVLHTSGIQFGLDNQNSNFTYNSVHIDRQIGAFYPLVEMNWFHYTGGGNRGLPAALGEGDGLLNLGTSGVTGNDLVTLAAGAKMKLGQHCETGFAWEFPVSNRKDLIDNRLTFEFLYRY